MACSGDASAGSGVPTRPAAGTSARQEIAGAARHGQPGPRQPRHGMRAAASSGRHSASARQGCPGPVLARRACSRSHACMLARAGTPRPGRVRQPCAARWCWCWCASVARVKRRGARAHLGQRIPAQEVARVLRSSGARGLGQHQTARAGADRQSIERRGSWCGRSRSGRDAARRFGQRQRHASSGRRCGAARATLASAGAAGVSGRGAGERRAARWRGQPPPPGRRQVLPACDYNTTCLSLFAPPRDRGKILGTRTHGFLSSISP